MTRTTARLFVLLALLTAAPAHAQDDACASLRLTVPLRFNLYEGEVERSEARLMDQVAERLRACPGQSFELQVHTDTVRMSSFNLRQSQAVADHVRALLAQRGVPITQLASCGYGEERPEVQDPTWEGTNGNTRLVVRAIEGPASRFVCRPRAPVDP